MRKLGILLSTIFIAAAMLVAVPLGKVQALTEEEAAWVDEARGVLQDILAEREVMALVYLSDTYAVRQSASPDGATVVEVPSGQTVFIQDVVIDDNYEAWAYVCVSYQGTDYCGYVQRANLACSDERFLNWEMEYGMNPGQVATYAATGAATVYADIEQFPASYRPALTALKEKHPNWTFVPMNTGLDWNTVIANEIGGGKSLVHSSFPAYCKEGAYDDGSWYYASEEVLKLYMDPRNSLHEDAIFQFEQLTYNASYHTEAAVKAFLDNTFMNSSKNAPGTEMKFHLIFWAIGAEKGREVSPFHLVARVLQEQGDGTSPLISGTYPGFEGYYNYFNVKASGKTTEEIIRNGLQYAKDKGWKGAYYSILGGADVISANYIKKGQDTLYLQKYNVAVDSPYGLYNHQYMQNISAPTSEAKSVKKLYAEAGALESTFVFKIPVYKNMPETPCAMPTASTNLVLQVPSGYTGSTIYVDGVPYNAVSRNGNYIAKLKNGKGRTAVAFQYDKNGVPTGMYVWTLSYANGAYAPAAQPGLKDLLTYHGFSVRVTGKSGIRFKTGISADTRNLLTTTGIKNYKLKEYGTLVMNNANRGTYPMIKGGEKVLSGMSYGTNANGVLEDVIYETVDGRHRYTSVLVGLPADQYKTEYAFGGYVTLEKNGQEITIYGPVVSRSIYSLAQQLINLGTYPAGSEADLFLRKLIADGDAAEAAAAQETEAQAASGTGTGS
ncbi:MAG: hypothetical protein E7291_03800 [Lachnospiraceae bacterium]|nr:hypothetical protein [Lachnospiraceae bacterium]